MIPEIHDILDVDIQKDEAECFDDGTYHVSFELLTKIYAKGYMDGKKLPSSDVTRTKEGKDGNC